MSLGTVYLIHFEKALGKQTTHGYAQHYIGFVNGEGLEARMKRHKAGYGAKIMKAVAQRGIEFSVVRVWKNVDRSFERQLKNRKNAPRYCPVCRRVRK